MALYNGSKPHHPDASVCTLCGEETGSTDSHQGPNGRTHYTCGLIDHNIDIQNTQAARDTLRIIELIGTEGVLLRRLRSRLAVYHENINGKGLTEMIRFIIGEIAKDPSIRPERKTYLRQFLEGIRKKYFGNNN